MRITAKLMLGTAVMVALAAVTGLVSILSMARIVSDRATTGAQDGVLESLFLERVAVSGFQRSYMATISAMVASDGERLDRALADATSAFDSAAASLAQIPGLVANSDTRAQALSAIAAFDRYRTTIEKIQSLASEGRTSTAAAAFFSQDTATVTERLSEALSELSSSQKAVVTSLHEVRQKSLAFVTAFLPLAIAFQSLVGLALSLVFARSITRPIRTLIAHAHETLAAVVDAGAYGDGAHPDTVPSHRYQTRRDEIGDMARVLDDSLRCAVRMAARSTPHIAPPVVATNPEPAQPPIVQANRLRKRAAVTALIGKTLAANVTNDRFEEL